MGKKGQQQENKPLSPEGLEIPCAGRGHLSKPRPMEGEGGACLAWKNFGRKSLNDLMGALESLGYNVNGNLKMADPRCDVYLKIGRSILKNYFEYNNKDPVDDTEYIPVVRVIIEAIAKEMKSSGL